MDKDLLYLVELSSIQLSEDQTPSSWVHALPVGDYTHPVWGKINITSDKIRNFAESVKNRVRGIDPSINISHGQNQSGDGEAAGWVKDAEARDDGLWVLVEWVKETAQAIKDKKWRYFSAEFKDSWTDPTGKTFKDVLFGGALTNRPYMKNLVPINLSEASVQHAFELVDAIQKGREAQEVPDLKKFAELLGLPENATEEQVITALSEIKTPKAPNTTQQPPQPTVPSVKFSEELKRLSEENPLVKTLVETLEDQHKANVVLQSYLREAEVSKKLAEFDNSKIILTPAAKDLVHDLLMDEQFPVELHEKFWGILQLLKSNSGMLVEMGERAGINVRYGRSKDAVTLFMDEASRVAAEKKIQLSEAMGIVSSEQPNLYNEYRLGATAFRE